MHPREGAADLPACAEPAAPTFESRRLQNGPGWPGENYKCIYVYKKNNTPKTTKHNSLWSRGNYGHFCFKLCLVFVWQGLGGLCISPTFERRRLQNGPRWLGKPLGEYSRRGGRAHVGEERARKKHNSFFQKTSWEQVCIFLRF